MPHSCGTCGQQFTSRNRLFRHLDASDHYQGGEAAESRKHPVLHRIHRNFEHSIQRSRNLSLTNAGNIWRFRTLLPHTASDCVVAVSLSQRLRAAAQGTDFASCAPTAGCGLVLAGKSPAAAQPVAAAYTTGF